MKKVFLIPAVLLAAVVLSAATHVYPVANRADAIKWNRLTNSAGQPDPSIAAYRIYVYSSMPSVTQTVSAGVSGAVIVDPQSLTLKPPVSPPASPRPNTGSGVSLHYYVRVTAVGTNGLEGPLSTALLLP